jgi:hypothetical protein
VSEAELNKALESLERRLAAAVFENARLRRALSEIANASMDGSTAQLVMALRNRAEAALKEERRRSRDAAT